MKNTMKVIFVLSVAALSGCASHHTAAHPKPVVQKTLTAKQMSKNSLADMDSGGPLTTTSPSAESFKLSGYHK